MVLTTVGWVEAPVETIATAPPFLAPELVEPSV